MTICYFVVRGLKSQDDGSVEFYEKSPVVHQLYDDVESWTGLTAAQVLYDKLPPGERDARNIMAVRAVAAQIGVFDALAEQGVRPDAVAGLSLGITTAACMAESLARQDAFRMMRHRQGLPEIPPNTAPQGVAWAKVPPGDDASRLYGANREGVYLGVDFGQQPDGTGHTMVLSGYRSALEELAADEPELVKLMPGTSAPHTPLRDYWSQRLRAFVSTLEFQDPKLPLIACLEKPATLTKAEDVQEEIWRNATRTASVPGAISEMVRHNVRLCVIVGPSLDENIIDWPFPAVYVKEPADLPKVMEQVDKLGIELTPAAAAAAD